MDWAQLAYWVAWPPSWAFIWSAFVRVVLPQFRPGRAAAIAWLNAGCADTLITGISRWWIAAGISAAHVAIGLWLLWRNRSRRDRAPKAYGAKSRALIAALARKAREAAQPRPVLRPVPEGS